MTTEYPKKCPLSINPSDKHQYINSPVRLKHVHIAVQQLMNKLPYGYELYPEISRPKEGKLYDSNFCRVHFHGYIIFQTPGDIERFFIEHAHILSRQTSICIKLEHDEKWETYIQKDSVGMQQYCKLEKITYGLTHESPNITEQETVTTKLFQAKPKKR